jgi:hypothetical protein
MRVQPAQAQIRLESCLFDEKGMYVNTVSDRQRCCMQMKSGSSSVAGSPTQQQPADAVSYDEICSTSCYVSFMA